MASGNVQIRDDDSNVKANVNDQDSAVGTSGLVVVEEAKSAQKTAVDDGDAVVPVTNLNGERVIAGHSWSTNANRVAEIDPVTQSYITSTLLNLTNIATNTTGYGHFDMNGFRYFALQGITSGTAPTDVLTVTIEATVQDDGTAPGSCTYSDVTNTLFSVANWVDTDFLAICQIPAPFKWVRVKYVTSNASGNDCDLTVYLKRMW